MSYLVSDATGKRRLHVSYQAALLDREERLRFAAEAQVVGLNPVIAEVG